MSVFVSRERANAHRTLRRQDKKIKELMANIEEERKMAENYKSDVSTGVSLRVCCDTVEPLNKGHFGSSHTVLYTEGDLCLEAETRISVEPRNIWRLSLVQRVFYRSLQCIHTLNVGTINMIHVSLFLLQMDKALSRNRTLKRSADEAVSLTHPAYSTGNLFKPHPPFPTCRRRKWLASMLLRGDSSVRWMNSLSRTRHSRGT